MRREKQHLQRPACLGWHAACEECDGTPDDDTSAGAPCAIRDGCRALVQFIGGELLRDDETIGAALALWPPHKIVRFLAGQDDRDEKAERRKVARAVSHRPTDPDYFDSLTVLDAVVGRMVRDADRVLVDAGERYMKKRSVYLRWHANGDAILREVRKGKAKDRTLAKFILRCRLASINIKVSTGDFIGAFDLDPPRGVPCRLWQDNSPKVVLVGVTPATARDAGTWLARVLAAGLIREQR